MFQRRTTTRSARTILKPLVALIALACVGVGAYILLRPAPVVNQPGIAGLPVDDLKEAVSEALVAIGHLENEKFTDADRILNDLAQKLPDEPLIARNLAICRVLTLESAGGNIEPERVQQALETLAKVEPESATTNWLTARAYLKLYEKNAATESGAEYRQKALQQLHEATRREPENASYWYQLYDALQVSNDPADKEESQKAIDQAYRAAPNNLRIVVDWFLNHVTARDPNLPKELDQIRPLIEPLAAGANRRTRLNLMDLFDRVKKAAEAGKWSEAAGPANGLKNILISEEVTQSDRRQVIKNPLEYVLYEFSQRVKGALSTADILAPVPTIPVKFDFVNGDQNLSEGVIDGVLTDMNLDGKVEAVVLKQSTVEVLELKPDGQPGAILISAPVPERMHKILIADLDRDIVATAGSVKAANQDDHEMGFYQADPDVVVFGMGGIRVLKNQLADDGMTRTLEEVKQEEKFSSMQNVLAGLLVDIDHEGDLDLVLSVNGAIQVWWNRDTAGYEDATAWSQSPPDLKVDTMALVDWDRDVDIDILVGGLGMPQSGLLENLRHGQVRWRPLEEKFDGLGGASTLLVWDTDGNASWDVMAAGVKGVNTSLTNTVPAQSVSVLRSMNVTDQPAATAMMFDYDNDGASDVVIGDLVVKSPMTNLYRGQRDGTFALTSDVLPESGNFQVVDNADFDRDGDLDLLVLRAGNAALLRNDGGNKNHWLNVRIRGEAAGASGRVNHHGIGSVLELKTEQSNQARIVQSQSTHFGLGAQPNPDVLRILFTNGIPQSIVQPKADQLVSEIMINKTSCPFVYGWTGKRFEFITDLLWNAPLGLQLADGVIAKDRPWEYLKIRGDQLLPKEGHYELKITEELWEAGYFDQVELIAIDHPQEVAIYSNEKVGPAEIAEYKVHTVRNRRPLVRAENQRGRDLLAMLAEPDGHMAVPFDHKFRKGRVEEHYLELDFGKLDSPQRIVLFLTGWIQPGDTSLSVAASHNPELPASLPPSIWTPDAQGKWHQTVPFMGFPGGKPKTIAVDVSDAFKSNDYRLRMVTNFELYWDEAFFTIDEEPIEIKQKTLALESADLHYRGFSETLPYRGPLPERYDYDSCSESPKWPPMRGRFTRYGDVKELLVATDHKLAVLAAGDEMTLRFELLPPPPEGWSRDFMLHNVGWDKDGDLNTITGQTVEPLPFVTMPQYPFESDEKERDESEMARYLREYQTRESSPIRFWRDW